MCIFNSKVDVLIVLKNCNKLSLIVSTNPIIYWKYCYIDTLLARISGKLFGENRLCCGDFVNGGAEGMAVLDSRNDELLLFAYARTAM